MGVVDSLRFILQHPLNNGRPTAALVRWLRWQVGSRVVSQPVVVPFVGQTKLIVRPGMTGATGNIYCGLDEFEDMALVLHALRPDDTFVDVGANVGSYTVLAGAAGAHCISIEPIPTTFACLKENILINRFEHCVQALNIGLSDAAGELRFTHNGIDSVNHVVGDKEVATDVVEVSVSTLDSVLDGRTPTVIKIDVEGFETRVLAGGTNALGDGGLLALIIELNGSGQRYGCDDETLRDRIQDFGLTPCRYFPLQRVLQPLGNAHHSGPNTIYVRDPSLLSERLRNSPRFQLGTGQTI